MASNHYHFITHWTVKSTVQEVSDVLGNATDLVRWWPSVYLEVNEVASGNTDGTGKVISLFTKGWLPYTLRWNFRVTASNEPYGFALDAFGDFVGQGIWTFEQVGDLVNITYDWKIRTDKPLLKYLSFVMKPLFSMNHQWAMRMGEESLRLELLRREATSEWERSKVPSPPLATPISLGQWLVYVITLATKPKKQQTNLTAKHF